MNSISTNPQQKLSLSETAKYTISAVILLIGFGMMVGLYQLRQSTNEKESDALIPLVETAPVQQFDGELDLMVSGTVVPFREIKVAAQVSGRVLTKYCECEAGSYVTKGTKLLEIDPRDYELEVKTMQSEIVQAEKTLAETDEEIRGAIRSLDIAKSDLELQKKEFRRFQKLKDSIAATEFDRAKRSLLNSESQTTLRQNTYDMLLAKKERLKASLELIRNRKEKAEINLERTVITAPVDGVIVRESVEPGDYVTVARELFVFEDTSRAEVLCNLTPGEVAWIRKYAGEKLPQSTELQTTANAQPNSNSVYDLPNTDVKIFDQSEPGVQWLGTLERFDGIGRNEMTKSIPCRIEVTNPVVETAAGNRALVRGMYVKCRMVVPASSTDGRLASFPSIAVRPGDYVWVVRDEKLNRFDLNVIDRSPMRESMSEEKRVVVSLAGSEMRIGDQVIVTPLPQPTEGGRVLLKMPNKDIAKTDAPAGPATDSSADQDQSTEVRTSSSSTGQHSIENERSQP